MSLIVAHMGAHAAFLLSIIVTTTKGEKRRIARRKYF
jgi:hypothetical protein